MNTLTPRERFQRALAGKPVDRPPVWFMRQAGRSLPEYRAIREEHSFLEVCSSLELAPEVTLQPVERFGMDAAVVFSDILLPLRRLGVEVRYEEGLGPVIEDPLRDPERVDALPVMQATDTRPSSARVVEAVRKARPELGIVGFAGAPFTLACYLIEGGSPGRFEHVHRFRHEHPDAFTRLLAGLGDLVAADLVAQDRAGADAVQIFDTHAEVLSPQAYADAPFFTTQRALTAVKEAATIAFARGSAHLLEPMRQLDADALSLDWRVDLAQVANETEKTLQGNLAPSLLLGPPGPARKHTRRVLEAGQSAAGHVFNLGHGVPRNARIDTIEAVVATVQGASS